MGYNEFYFDKIVTLRVPHWSRDSGTFTCDSPRGQQSGINIYCELQDLVSDYISLV
jgi:hypothetical protein